MELYLIRHGAAENLGAKGNFTDDARDLTKQGAIRAEKVGEGLRKLDVKFDLILTSPALRASRTASEIRKGMRLPAELIRIAPELGTDARIENMVELINQNFLQYSQVALVSHQPNLSLLASWLLSEGSEIEFKMSRAGVVCLQTGPRLEAGRASLLWKMLPGQLVQLAD